MTTKMKTRLIQSIGAFFLLTSTASYSFANPSLPNDFQLTSVVETMATADGGEVFPSFDLTISADDQSVVFRWKFVCFPECKPNLQIPQLQKFFQAFGFTQEQTAGISQIILKFNRKSAICKQSAEEIAAVSCSFSNDGDHTTPVLMFSKEDGTTINMQKYVSGALDTGAATRVVRGFGYGIPNAPYLRYDAHVSLVGHQVNDPEKSAHGIFDLLDLPVPSVIVNGTQDPAMRMPKFVQ